VAVELRSTLGAADTRIKKGPVLISIEYNSNPQNPSADVRQCIEFLDAQAIRLANPAR
jgi:hypothetical protein